MPLELSASSIQPTFDEASSYRSMAARCRKMALTSRRPGALILRAEAYDACALEAERIRERR